MTTNDLIPEQVQKYEAQAAAGKKPVHPGWYNCIHLPFFNCQEGHALLTYRVYKSQDKHGGPAEWLLCTDEWKPAIATFTNEAAAMLAAEDLLRIDTACLNGNHGARIRHLEKKCAKLNLVARCFDCLVYAILGGWPQRKDDRLQWTRRCIEYLKPRVDSDWNRERLAKSERRLPKGPNE